jgi:hypothetical protein
MNTIYNFLTIKIFEPYSTNERYDPWELLDKAVVKRFTTFYPGGLFGLLVVEIAADLSLNYPWEGGDRISVYNGLQCVWEGAISFIGYRFDKQGKQTLIIEGTGYWGWLLKKYQLDKRWADNRLRQDIWYFPIRAGISQAALDKMTYDRHNRIRFVPKKEQFQSNTWTRIMYEMPEGSNVKRIKWTWELVEAGSDWELRLEKSLNDSGWTTVFSTVTSGGPTARDDTITGTYNQLSLIFRSVSTQTPSLDGINQTYAEATNIMVYSETGAIDLHQICLDILGLMSSTMHGGGINLDSSATFALEPFYTNGPESVADILLRAASHGDSNFNPWAVYILPNEESTTKDGKPVLGTSPYPPLTDYDYQVSFDSKNLAHPFQVSVDYDYIVNYIFVKYQDEQGLQQVVTPTDDSGLTDGDSVSAYGEHRLTVNGGRTGLSTAKNLAKRILASRKNPRFIVSGPIKVKGYLEKKEGGRTPVSEVRPGERIKIQNFIEDISGISGAGLTFIITATSYDHKKETLSISTGLPDDLAVFMAQRKLKEDATLGA